MQLYTIHTPPDDGENFQVVKDGFSWPALVLTVFWALWHRMWWVALGIVAVDVLLSLFTNLTGADELTQGALGLAFAVIVGLVANDLRRWTLARRGYDEAAVVAAEDADAALHRYLDNLPEPEPEPAPVSAAPPPHTTQAQSFPGFSK